MKASRITFLHPHPATGDDVEINNGAVYRSPRQVKIKKSDEPDWLTRGVYIVASDKRKNTIEGYIVDIRRNQPGARGAVTKLQLEDPGP